MKHKKSGKIMRRSILLAASLTFVGCFNMNMPTPPSQITGSYVSGIKYTEYSCAKLSAEFDSLTRRENQLVVAQNQRIKSSNVQGFWMGYGQGDGIEASELANVRGDREAVRKAMENKNCDAKPSLKSL